MQYLLIVNSMMLKWDQGQAKRMLALIVKIFTEAPLLAPRPNTAIQAGRCSRGDDHEIPDVLLVPKTNATIIGHGCVEKNG